MLYWSLYFHSAGNCLLCRPTRNSWSRSMNSKTTPSNSSPTTTCVCIQFYLNDINVYFNSKSIWRIYTYKDSIVKMKRWKKNIEIRWVCGYEKDLILYKLVYSFMYFLAIGRPLFNCYTWLSFVSYSIYESMGHCQCIGIAVNRFTGARFNQTRDSTFSLYTFHFVYGLHNLGVFQLLSMSHVYIKMIPHFIHQYN